MHRVRIASTTVIAVAVAMVGFTPALAERPDARAAAVCADYPNQKAAQQAHDTIDADHDGIYCEDLPCPCLKPGSGTQAPPSSNPPSGSGPALFKGRCKRGRLPDYRCTPGAVFRNVTADDLCAPGYSKRVRNVSESSKRKVYLAYGIRRHRPYAYEIDHLVSLELGGNNSHGNLWPEKEPGARDKDKLENRLHADVCDGSITLRRAQAEIKHWTNFRAAATSIKTKARIVRPFSATGRSRLRTKTRRGLCFTGSLATVRRDAWRCFVGNGIVDPCFSSSHVSGVVLCPRAAWKHTGIRLELRQPLPRAHGRRPSIKLQPWGLQLVDGRHCGMVTGGTEAIGGKRANFACTGNDWLWGFPNRSTQPWTIFNAAAGATVLSARAPIRRAWM